MDNSGNLQHKHSYNAKSIVNQNKMDGISEVDKENGNGDSINKKSEDFDNTRNILSIKNSNSEVNNSVNVKVTSHTNSCNEDVQNGNTPQVAYRVSNQSQNVHINNTNTNLRRTQMAKSNPQLHVSSSYVDVHPLSTSMMETPGNIHENSAANANLNASQNTRDPLQMRHSQSANVLHEDALRRITEQFTPSHIPIVGYEVMEERARFTIYKLRIDDPRTGLSWMVFRRYTDFVRLYQKLKMEHRDLILPLPEKRVFRNNFDPSFLEERSRGLQLFVNAVVKRLSLDRSVREFFCLDEPPDVGDSEPEAQALFGALEDTVGSLKNQLRQQEDTIKFLRQKIYYLEEKMKSCSVCNPLGVGAAHTGHSPMSSASSNGS